MAATIEPFSKSEEIIRLFSRCFRGWKDSNGLRDGSKQPRWYLNQELSASIRAWLELNPSGNAETFARYCLTNLNDINSRHLSAFLQKIGFDVAKFVFHDLRKKQDSHRGLPLENSLEEVYQYAWIAASNPTDFFKNFDSERPGLQKYVATKIKGIIYDGIFARNNSRISNYGLLRRLGQRQREEALRLQGQVEPMLSHYCLVWECFYQICTANSRGRISPTEDDWQAITQQYNRLKRQLPEQIINQNVDFKKIQEWIENVCIPAAKDYLFPNIVSIDINNEETNAPIEISDTSSSLPEGLLSQQEINQLVNNLTVQFPISTKLEELDSGNQIVLLLRYGLELTQVQVAREMRWLDKNSQPINSQVSRCEDRVTLTIFNYVVSWVQEQHTHNQFSWFTVEVREKLNLNMFREMRIKPVVEEVFLSRYYLSLVKSYFDTDLPAFKCTREQIVELGVLIPNVGGALEFVQQISQLERYRTQANRLLDLHQYIVNQIQTRFNVTLQSSGPATERIMVMVLDWLKGDSEQPNN